MELMVTYLEMMAPPSSPPQQPPVTGLAVERERLGRADYIALYRAIGEPFQWDDRLRIDNEELNGLLADPSTCIYVLRLQDRAVGLCEFVGIGQPEVELVHFGLVPA